MASLKTREYFLIPALGIVGILLFVLLYSYAFPDLDANVQISSGEAKEISDNFLKSLGQNPDEYKSSTIFITDYTESLFVEETLGKDHIKNISANQSPIWGWTTAYYKELEKDRWEVSVTPQGEFIGFKYYIEDNVPGASLNESEALEIVEEFISSQEINLSNYEKAEFSSTKQENRIDYYFEWKKLGFNIPYNSSNATVRLIAEVYGDKIGSFNNAAFDVPEEFQRDQQKLNSVREIFGLLSMFVTALLYITILVFFIKDFKKVSKRFALTITLIATALMALSTVNAYQSISFGYNGLSSFTVYYTNIALYTLIGMVFGTLALFLATGAGEVVARSVYKNSVDGITKFKQRLFSKEFSKDALIGYSLAGIILGFDVIYYSLGKSFGFWSPADSINVAAFNSLLPFLIPLTIGFIAAVSEEFIFRAFAVSLAKKYLKYTWLAVLIPAVIWAFGHSGYIVFPVYVRFIELTIVGVIFGYAFIRYGIIPNLIAHYVINSVYGSIPLLLSGSSYYLISGVLVIALAAIPALFGLFIGKQGTVVGKK